MTLEAAQKRAIRNWFSHPDNYGAKAKLAQTLGVTRNSVTRVLRGKMTSRRIWERAEALASSRGKQ